MNNEGIVFDIQRFSVHDGPGIRTLVFLKGCSLRCEWCANPESQRFTPEILFDPARCISCENCLALCPNGALKKNGDRLLFEKGKCVNCGTCVEQCYAEARVLKGQKMTVEEVVAEVLKDEPFYSESGGGVTLSGGEPLDQPEFAASILEACKRLALHTAIETAGHVPWSSFEKNIPFTDLFLFDVKHTNDVKMQAHTKADTDRIVVNLEKLVMDAKQVVVRIPVIPDFNDSPEDIRQIVGLANRLDIKEIHLLPYHRYGLGKYKLMGRKYGFDGPDRVEEERIQLLKDVAAMEGLKVQIGG